MIANAMSGLRAAAMLVAAVWLVSLANLALGGPLDAWGIRPRRLDGAIGIVAAPFLHVSLAHLVGNTVPMLVLAGLVCLRGAARFWLTTALIAVVGGAGVWLVARSAIHLGASGLVFGYLGYVLALGWFEGRPFSVALALVAGFLYSGLLWGVLPLNECVSWEGHLFGLLAGIAIAKLHARPVPPAPTS